MRRTQGRWSMVRLLVLACVAALGLGGLTGCQTHEDAIAAAQQMAETAQTLQKYYATLDALVAKTEEARLAQRYLLHGPPDSDGMARLEERRSELAKRAVLADQIARLAAAFGEITDSTAADDAAKAAEGLRSEVASLKPLSHDDVIKQALQVAVTSLVNLVRARDEKKAAQNMVPVLTALCNFYDAEMPAYVLVPTDFYTQAAANATELNNRGQLAMNALYRSSVEPFGLEAQVDLPDLKAAARDDLNGDVEAKKKQLIQDSADAAAALSTSLHRMQSRVDTVAKGNAMRLRVPPLTLGAVKAWISELETLTGVSL